MLELWGCISQKKKKNERINEVRNRPSLVLLSAPRNIWDLLSALRRLPTRGTGKMHFHLAPWSIRKKRPTDPGPCPNEGACATGLPHCGLESLQEPFPKLQSLCTSQDLFFCLLNPGRTLQCFYGTQVDSISGSGSSLTEGNSNPLQYSCLENPHGQRSLVGYSPRGHKESDTTWSF